MLPLSAAPALGLEQVEGGKALVRVPLENGFWLGRAVCLCDSEQTDGLLGSAVPRSQGGGWAADKEVLAHCREIIG